MLSVCKLLVAVYGHNSSCKVCCWTGGRTDGQVDGQVGDVDALMGLLELHMATMCKITYFMGSLLYR